MCRRVAAPKTTSRTLRCNARLVFWVIHKEAPHTLCRDVAQRIFARLLRTKGVNTRDVALDAVVLCSRECVGVKEKGASCTPGYVCYIAPSTQQV